MPVTYMQNGIKRKSSDVLRLTLPKGLKDHMAEKYGIHENYLILENGIFKDMDNIKKLKIYMPEDETVRLIVIYEVADAEARNDNGHYLSIDLGIHNFMTCHSGLPSNRKKASGIRNHPTINAGFKSRRTTRSRITFTR